MAFSTIYDVKVRYSVDNRAGRAVGGLTDDTRKLGREVRATSSAFGRLGTVIVGAFGARAAGKALISFNSTVEDTKLQIAGMLSLAKKTDLVAQIKPAEALYARLQKRAMSLPGTTQDYVNMAGRITRVVTDAGGSMKELEDLTVNGTVAARALGEQWEVAARDIEQAIMGRYNTTDPFLSKILPSIGYAGEEGREKWRALGSNMKRLEELKRAIMQPQISQLGAASGQTFSGVVSTLKDTLGITMGKVGLPLFKAVTAEVKNWNQWLSQNSDRVGEIAKSIGEGLVKGFGVVKDALGFLVNNAGTLLTIGKVWLAVKLGGMIGGGLASKGGGIVGAASSAFAWGRGASDRFNPETGAYEHTKAGAGRQAVGGFKGAMGNLPLLGQSLAAGYAVGTLLNDALGLSDGLRSLLEPVDLLGESTRDNAKRFEELERASAALKDAIARASGLSPDGPQVVNNLAGMRANYAQRANLVADMLRAQEAVNNGGGTEALKEYLERRDNVRAYGIGDEDINKAGGAKAYVAQMQSQAEALATRQGVLGATGFAAFNLGITQLTEYQRRTLDEAKAQQEILVHINQQLAKGAAVNPQTVMDILRNSTQDPSGKHKVLADKPKVNVTIQRIEVQSDDPDRMAFGLIESFRDAAKNPSSALAAIREG